LKTFTDLAEKLLEEGFTPVWFWDPERPLDRERIAPDRQRVVQAPLAEVAAEMARCRAVVAGDTGLAHLASAAGRPVVSIFGSTVPELGYTPVGRHCVVEVDLPCRPCHVHGARRCWMGHRRCLNEIGFDILIHNLKQLL
jgi:ADP-heptose:LPS heptosyltransferase